MWLQCGSHVGVKTVGNEVETGVCGQSPRAYKIVQVILSFKLVAE